MLLAIKETNKKTTSWRTSLYRAADVVICLLCRLAESLCRRSWEQVTGEPVAELGLFFTDNLSYMKLV